MKTKSNKKIQILHNGPYKVTGSVPLNRLRLVPNNEGASQRYEVMWQYPLQETYHLCRCGGSKNKPLCDGTHTVKSFNSEETASHKPYEELAELIEGSVIDLLDAESYCAVARFCDMHGSTWRLISESTDPEDKELIVQQCNNCPSGRLTAVTKSGRKIEPELPEEISILEDPIARVHGPIWVKGGILIEDERGRAYPVRNRVTLCRCGNSQNKPFCDAQHMRGRKEDIV